MTVYMVFEPPRRGDDPVRHAERIVFVRDRFSWGAFLFAPIWMLWRRLWLTLIGYLIVMSALMVGLTWLGVGSSARFWTFALISLLIGFEAATLRRWSLLRRGWRELSTVIGDDREAAERRFFDAYAWVEVDRAMHASTVSPSSTSSPPPPPQPAGSPQVLGLFPQPGGSG
jgi:hypothetical protein